MVIIETYPVQTAVAIALVFMLILALTYPATLYCFRVKFNYTHGNTLMQFWKQPNILARIFFYSKKTQVRYIGHVNHWHTFPKMHRVKSKRMIAFLNMEEKQSKMMYDKRTIKKVRA